MTMLKRVLPAFVIALLVISGCQQDKYDFDALPDLVKSYFTHDGGEDPLNINEEVRFTNASENADSYTWHFGDGTTSTEANPTKIYTTPGLYTVRLTAVGKGGTGNYSMDLAVIDPDAVVESDSELYFIEYGSSLVRKLSLIPGSSVETVVDMSGMDGHGMAYDAVNDKIYYVDFETTNSGKLWRMNS